MPTVAEIAEPVPATQMERIDEPLTGWLRVIDKMIDRGCTADILTQVFALQQKADVEMQRKQFVEAFTAMKAEAPSSIPRTKTVSHATKDGAGKSYDQVELDNACAIMTPFLSKHGLAASWELSPPDDKGLITVSCCLEHVGGHARRATLKAHADPSGGKNEHQAIGSGLAYLERYTYMGVLGLAQAGMDDESRMNGGNYIGDEELAILNGLIEEAKTLGVKYNPERFRSYLEVESLDKMGRKQFLKGCQYVQTKIAEARKGAAK